MFRSLKSVFLLTINLLLLYIWFNFIRLILFCFAILFSIKDLFFFISLGEKTLNINLKLYLPRNNFDDFFYLGLRDLFMGGNQIEEIPSGIKELGRLRFLYLGGNLIRKLPAEICRLEHLRALTLCNNRLESLPGLLWFIMLLMFLFLLLLFIILLFFLLLLFMLLWWYCCYYS